MTEKKKQHYVPRFYLKQFASDENKFFVYDFEKNGLLSDRPVPCESQCYKKYFYGEDGIWEELLSKKEGVWASIIDKVIKKDDLTIDEINSIKEFILFQKQRTQDENNHSIEQREAMIREYAKALYYFNNWEFDEEAENFCKNKSIEDMSPAENVLMATKMLKYVDDLDILIIHFNTMNKLVTSDAPVITLNYFMEITGFGYDNIGISYLMPITPEHVVIMYDAQVYQKYRGFTFVESYAENEVEVVNRYEFIHAEQKVFYSQINAVELIDEMLLERRKKEIERNKTSYLGPENMPGRLIIAQSSGTQNYYELPYLTLPRDFKRIPFVCREAIPRHFHKGWDTKLEKKYTMLLLAKTLPNNIDSLEISKGNLRLGCRRMEKLGKQYWQKKGYKISD